LDNESIGGPRPPWAAGGWAAARPCGGEKLEKENTKKVKNTRENGEGENPRKVEG
jgi:hypothetical protein